MSRKGRMPILLPSDVSINFDNQRISVVGPLGEMARVVDENIDLSVDNGYLMVIQNSKLRNASAIHGLERSLINNMIIGVSKGFNKTLRMVGTGYKAFLEKGVVDFKIMKSHPVKFMIPDGVKVEIDNNSIIKLFGKDKMVVGQTAAKMRDLVKKDPYKGKGIHIDGEFIRRKAGKSSKKGK